MNLTKQQSKLIELIENSDHLKLLPMPATGLTRLLARLILERASQGKRTRVLTNASCTHSLACYLQLEGDNYPEIGISYTKGGGNHFALVTLGGELLASIGVESGFVAHVESDQLVVVMQTSVEFVNQKPSEASILELEKFHELANDDLVPTTRLELLSEKVRTEWLVVKSDKALCHKRIASDIELKLESGLSQQGLSFSDFNFIEVEQ